MYVRMDLEDRARPRLAQNGPAAAGGTVIFKN
jgi:hypothetical protein